MRVDGYRLQPRQVRAGKLERTRSVSVGRVVLVKVASVCGIRFVSRTISASS
jgi:hypothetical protein